jgi:hypothetical protein
MRKITAKEIVNLNRTPVELLPPPGKGKAYKMDIEETITITNGDPTAGNKYINTNTFLVYKTIEVEPKKSFWQKLFGR